MWELRPGREVAVRALQALFEGGDRDRVPVTPGPPRPSTAAGRELAAGCRQTLPLTTFQAEGARRIREILARRGGAILADGVGLGKTYIALAIVEERIRAGHDVVVIVPASLRRTWRAALRRLDRGQPDTGGRDDHGAAGRTVARAGAEGSHRRGPSRWRLVSHAQLSRGITIRPAAGPRLVVVDEAHRFRNPATHRYRALARLVSGPLAGHQPVQLLLITATPVNNSVQDLYHLVRLFLPDDALMDAGVPSLLASFRPGPGAGSGFGAGGAFSASGVPSDYDAGHVRAVARATLVRRTRGMVQQRYGDPSPPGANVGFPRRAPPSIERYSDPGIRQGTRCIDALELRAYETGAGPLVRLGLLKRLDSSRAALAVSAARLRSALEAVADAADAGRLMRPGARPLAGDADPLQLFLLDVVADEAPADVDLAALAASCRRDIGVLQRLVGIQASPDAKVEALEALLERLSGEKVIVFTEYRDTAEALAHRLSRRFRVGRVDGSGAWLGRRPAGRRAVVVRFAPAANHRAAPPDRERVDVLIATDVLSEGLNLQDARHVVSYDLPWNPVRLLQRIGRVDRLGSPHSVVVPHLFVPVEGLDVVLGLTRRLRAKLDGIAVAVGGTFTDSILEGLRAGRPDVVNTALERVAEREAHDPWERLRTLWLRTRVRSVEGKQPAPGPSRWVGVVEAPDGHAAAAGHAVVLATHGSSHRLLEITADGRVGSAGPTTAAAMEMALTAAALQGSPTTREATAPPAEVRDRASMAARRTAEHLRAEVAARRAPPPMELAGTEARLARRLQRSLSAAGSGLDPGTLRDAEAALQALSVPLGPAARASIDLLLGRTDDGVPPGRLIRKILRLLTEHGLPGSRIPEPSHPAAEPPGPGRSGAGDEAPEPRVEAVLLTQIRRARRNSSANSGGA